MSPKPLVLAGSCSRCTKSLPKNEFMRCTVCRASYDLECANVSSKRFYSFYAAGSNRTSTWKCPECISKQSKKDTPVRQDTSLPTKQKTDTQLESPDNDKANITIRTKRNTVSLEEDRLMDTEWTDSEKFELLLKEMRSVRQEMSMMNATMTGLHATIKEQNTRIDHLETRIDNIEYRMSESRHIDVSGLQETILQLKSDIHDRDQQLLSNDIEISSLPEQPNENPTHIFLTIAKKLGVNIEERDVVSAERAGPERGAAEGGLRPRPRPLVARLTRRSARDLLLQAARVRRNVTTEGMGFSGTTGRLFINERLTKVNRQLFHKAREAAKRLNWRYIWTRDGRIFARRAQGDAVHRLRTDADVDKVFGLDSVGAPAAHPS